MFDRLKKKWKVNSLRLTLILCTFALGGSLTGYAGRKLMAFIPVEQNWLWITIYILLITLLWPLAVLLMSIPFGQFAFFVQYLRKIGRRMGLGRSRGGKQVRIAIFASGAGSNAQKIIEHFRNSTIVKIVLIACNKKGAGVLNIAEKEGIPVLMLEKEKFIFGNAYLEELKEKQVDLLVLAGFLWKVPDLLIQSFPGRIINIHPALLPKFGGKGMYGERVHQAVIEHHEKESGISIHYVDGHYDNGDIIFQARCPVMPEDTAASLAQRIHQLEHAHFPRVVEELAIKIAGEKKQAGTGKAALSSPNRGL